MKRTWMIYVAMFCAAELVCAQSATPSAYAISTVAGVGVQAFAGEGQVATGALLFSPTGIAVDASGAVYFSDTYYQRILKVGLDGSLTTFAGTGTKGYSGDGGPATSAQLYSPQGMAFEFAGNLYVADSTNERIRKITSAGIISTVAGSGAYGYNGDNRQALSAELNGPSDVKVDSTGNLYIADRDNNRIRKVDPSGNITTIAGSGVPGYTGDGNKATAAELVPSGLALDAAGDIYFSDEENYVVRKISAADGTISTVAGTGVTGFSGDTGKATLAALTDPVGLTVDASGNLYIVDAIESVIREVDTNGIITTVAGQGSVRVSGGDGGPASVSDMIVPLFIAVDAAGDLFVTDSQGRRVRRIDGKTSIISRVAGEDITGAAIGDGAVPTQASFYDPAGVAVDQQGNLYVADSLDQRIRKIANGTISTVIGNGLLGNVGDGGPGAQAELNDPSDLNFDSTGNLYFATGYKIRELNNQGVMSTIAGTGTEGYSGDNGTATRAKIFGSATAFDPSGNLYLADTDNNRLRKITPGGIITTIAGTGQLGYSGDGGAATSAEIYSPIGIAVDAAGNIYFSDNGNNRVRKINPAGIITTFAGNGVQSVSGDGGPAAQASIPFPTAVAVDAAGNVYVCTSARIRRINSAGIISTIAGTGQQGYTGDGGSAILATLNNPTGIAFDGFGAIYFADESNQVIRKLTPANFFAAGVVNAASMAAGAVTPGEIVTIFGASLGPAQLTLSSANASGQLAASSGGTQVLFDGHAAPMIYASAGQVSAIVPYEVAGQSQTMVQIVYQGAPTNTVALNVTDASPALFTSNSSGKGQAAALNQDGSVNSPSNPAAAGSVVVLYGTGEGQTNPSGVDGQYANSTYPAPVDAVKVTVGGKQAQVLYFGAAPGEVAGLFQANVQLPPGLTGNATAVSVTVGSHVSPAGVSIAIH